MNNEHARSKRGVPLMKGGSMYWEPVPDERTVGLQEAPALTSSSMEIPCHPWNRIWCMPPQEESIWGKSSWSKESRSRHSIWLSRAHNTLS
jgi:hypothetical protein